MNLPSGPDSVIFCATCVVSNQRPNSTVEFLSKPGDQKNTIQFSQDGICDACLATDEKESQIDWDAREAELKRLAESAPMVNGYNCIVPGSGGKDSAFTAHILKYKYGFSPLTVTWAPHLYTEIGWQNFQNWMHVGGLDNLLFTPNGRLHRELTKRAFENLLHPFQPFIVGQRLIGPRIASRYGINLVFYGENQAEYGNPREENSDPKMSTDFFESSTKDPNLLFLGGNSVRQIIEETDFEETDFAPYMPLTPEEAGGIEVRYLGYYERWDPQDCYYYATENTGFAANPIRTEGSYSRYSSIDDKIDPFHYYTTLIKFGIGRATYDASQEIRNGKITREEGVALVRKYDTEFPFRYFEEFLNYIDSTEAQFWDTIDSWRPKKLWEKNGRDWTLRHQVE